MQRILESEASCCELLWPTASTFSKHMSNSSRPFLSPADEIENMRVSLARLVEAAKFPSPIAVVRAHEAHQYKDPSKANLMQLWAYFFAIEPVENHLHEFKLIVYSNAITLIGDFVARCCSAPTWFRANPGFVSSPSPSMRQPIAESQERENNVRAVLDLAMGDGIAFLGCVRFCNI